MRLPNLSASIDRRIPGSSPTGQGPGTVRPQQVHPVCSGECVTDVQCTQGCECGSNGTCVPKQPRKG